MTALEKAAAAVLECDASCDDYFNRDIGMLLSVNPETALAIARAVLMAVRGEVDYAMTQRLRLYYHGEDVDFPGVFSLVIQDILNEEPK